MWKGVIRVENRFGHNADGDRSDWVRIEFKGLTKDQLECLSRAERELFKAGIVFDTGYDFEENRRDWELDWSLKGAVVKVRNKDEK